MEKDLLTTPQMAQRILFIPSMTSTANHFDRFVCTPIPDVQKRLKEESEALTKEMSNLDKKEDYLEKTYTNSKNSIEQVLKGAS
jgi:hypothetical protein